MTAPEERDDEGREREEAAEPQDGAPEETAAPDEAAPPEEGPQAEAEPAEVAEEPQQAEEPDAAEEPAAAEEAPAPRRRERGGERAGEEELIPGAHLEPDLVLDEERRPEGEFGELAEAEVAAAEQELAQAEPAEGEEAADAPARQPLDLAADARYAATGKRKSAVARVILRPGEGTYTINRRHLDEYFPRIRLQRMARQPLEAAGYQARMDVVARIHGGGVSAQATALRHGIARALVEADPSLRGELKRRGYLTRDPRVKERKKAGLKKARKRPQFSKR
jgi:small subunit ribosomal protein S9